MPRLRLNRNQPAAHALPQRYEKTGAQINLAIKKTRRKHISVCDELVRATGLEPARRSNGS